MSELASRPSRAATPPQASAPTPNEPEPVLVPEQMRPDDAPTVLVPPSAPGSAASGTTAGTLLAGRYRLRTRVGSDTTTAAEFWRAEDTVLLRDVSLTVLRRLPTGDPRTADAPREDPTGAERAGEMVVRALRSGAFEHPGCARLLDVLAPGAPGVPDDVLGAAVTEWVPGRSLAEAVADGMLRPVAAARAVAPLAAAAEEAHRHGLVLGCDHPQRVRITSDGRAQLCFVLPRPDVTPADDVRGLGAVLYTLLTSRWPLSGTDAARAGLRAADRTPAGAPTAPSRRRPGLPVELDALAVGALGPGDSPGHVHTAAAVHRMLADVVEEGDRVALFPPAHDGVPADPGDVWQDGNRGAPADPQRRRRLMLGLIGLGAAVLLVLGYVATQLGSVFSDAAGPAIVVAPGGPADTSSGAGQARTGGVAAVANVEVYDDNGDRDNAGRIARVIDGDTGSGWRTSTYRQQFPALKPGVGIMASFASAVQLAALTVDSPSAGTVVQVRSAPSPGAALDETTLITEVTLEKGATSVLLSQSQPTTHLLLWITKLGGSGGEHLTEIDEVEFRRAGS